MAEDGTIVSTRAKAIVVEDDGHGLVIQPLAQAPSEDRAPVMVVSISRNIQNTLVASPGAGNVMLIGYSSG